MPPNFWNFPKTSQPGFLLNSKSTCNFHPNEEKSHPFLNYSDGIVSGGVSVGCVFVFYFGLVWLYLHLEDIF